MGQLDVHAGEDDLSKDVKTEDVELKMPKGEISIFLKRSKNSTWMESLFTYQDVVTFPPFWSLDRDIFTSRLNF